MGGSNQEQTYGVSPIQPAMDVLAEWRQIQEEQERLFRMAAVTFGIPSSMIDGTRRPQAVSASRALVPWKPANSPEFPES
jgi:hypothetical protein